MIFKKFLTIPQLIITSTLLFSCVPQNKTVYASNFFYSAFDSNKYTIDQSKDPNKAVTYFGSSMSIQVQHFETNKEYESKYNELLKQFDDIIAYYHVLFDRHNSYKDSNGNKVNNLYTINESYGSGNAVRVDKVLYDAIKSATEFSKNSNYNGRDFYSVAIGGLADYYQDLIDNMKTLFNSRNIYSLLGQVNLSLFGQGPKSYDKERFEKLKVCTPKSDELDDLLKFNDDNSIEFKQYKDCTKDEISLSLSAYGKGLATQLIAESFPDLTMMINGGSSSIKVNGPKLNNKDWYIVINNPVQGELGAYADPIFGMFAEKTYPYLFNEVEVQFKEADKFNLSTSGYYEQFFYYPVYINQDNRNLEEVIFDDPNNYNNKEAYCKIDGFRRATHIVDPSTGLSAEFFDSISVLLDNTGLADMYTTALMNSRSLEEAKGLLDHLNTIYNEKADAIFVSRLDLEEASMIDEYSPIYKKADFFNTPYFTGEADEDLGEKEIQITRKTSDNLKMNYYVTDSMKDRVSIIPDNTIISRNSWSKLQPIIANLKFGLI